MKTCLSVALLSVVLLAGCRDREAEAAAQAAAQAAASEAAADEAARAFEAAVADGNWALAKAQGDLLFAQWPTSDAAARVREQYEEAKAKGHAETEARRVAALWIYQTQPVKGGEQLSAAIYARDELDVDGSGAKPVRLIFRDHPDWGRSAYLVLEAGDFDCYAGCQLKVTVDGKVHTLPGSRPKTDDAIAMFVEDWKALWKLAKGGKQLSIEFPTKAVGKRSAEFEVGGLDASKLPKWN